jgi:hypothetical protein
MLICGLAGRPARGPAAAWRDRPRAHRVMLLLRLIVPP